MTKARELSRQGCRVNNNITQCEKSLSSTIARFVAPGLLDADLVFGNQAAGRIFAALRLPAQPFDIRPLP